MTKVITVSGFIEISEVNPNWTWFAVARLFSIFSFLISVIGKNCLNIGQFHLDIWCEDIEDIEALSEAKLDEIFLQLQDLKIKCQDFVETLPRQGEMSEKQMFENDLLMTLSSIVIKHFFNW